MPPPGTHISPDGRGRHALLPNALTNPLTCPRSTPLTARLLEFPATPFLPVQTCRQVMQNTLLPNKTSQRCLNPQSVLPSRLDRSPNISLGSSTTLSIPLANRTNNQSSFPVTHKVPFRLNHHGSLAIILNPYRLNSTVPWYPGTGNFCPPYCNRRYDRPLDMILASHLSIVAALRQASVIPTFTYRSSTMTR